MSGKRGVNKSSQRAAAMRANLRPDEDETYTFSAEHDDEGVWFYQAFNDGIADWAIEHGALGGPLFNPTRMTWIKPSFAWMLYRCGYANKHSQQRVLKLKLTHNAVATLLADCACKHGGGGAKGRVQWDPARDLYSSEGKGEATEPRKMLRERAIQIGLSRDLSERFVTSIVAVVDVSALAKRVGEAHRSKDVRGAMEALRAELPDERPYMPRCAPRELVRLRLIGEGDDVAIAAAAAKTVAAAAASLSPSSATAVGDASAEQAAQVDGGEDAAAEIEMPESCQRQRSWGEISLSRALPTG